MKQLLDSMAVLADPGATPADKQAASTFVVSCHDRAEESCHILQQQLAYAEEFKNLLADRAR
jgi:hypothetical protein